MMPTVVEQMRKRQADAQLLDQLIAAERASQQRAQRSAVVNAPPRLSELPSDVVRGLLDPLLQADLGINEAMDYYLGPTGIPDRLRAVSGLLDPGVYETGYAAADLVDPRVSDADRYRASQDVAMGLALAPMAFMRPAQGAVGDAMQSARDDVRAFLRSEYGGVPLTRENAPMVGQHNLSTTGVQVASDIGGIPMPSMAIVRANQPLEKFGDVTLLAQPDMVLPSRNVNVWPNDAYTGRQPRGEVQFANEKTARDALKANPDFGHMRDATYWMDAANSIADADEMMKTAQLGVAEGIDPKKYSSMWDYVSDVRAKLGYSAYEDAPKMPGFQAYVDMERVLYPAERYTQSGNLRKPQPYTLDTVMRRMGADKAYTAGSEGWDYGPGSFRALVSPAFRNADEVKASRGLLATGDNFAPVADAFRDAYGSVRADLEQYAKTPRLVYEAPEALAEIARTGRADWFGNVPAEVRGYINDLAATARTMPTEYFEAKPKVAYSLGDFPAALVPESAPQTADILRNAGVRDVLTYGPGTSRAELIQRFPQLFFSAAAAGAPLGLLAMQPNEEY